MKKFFQNIFSIIIAVPLTIIGTIILYINTNLTFFIAFLLSLLSVVALITITNFTLDLYFHKKHKISFREYLFIRKNLRQANKKLKRLYKSLFSIHHLQSVRQRITLVRLIRRIFKIIKKEPKRYYKAERFIYSHLNSVVEIMEKFVFLASHPNKNDDLKISLKETEQALVQLTKSIDKELLYIIADDLDDLHFEIDLANYRSNKLS